MITKYLRPICFFFTILGVSLIASACGIKSAPQHPSGSKFPAAYPILEKPAVFSLEGGDQFIPAEPRSGSSLGIYQYPNPPSYEPPKE